MFLVFNLLPGVGRARYHWLYLWIVYLPRGDMDVDARLFIDHCYVSFVRVLIFFAVGINHKIILQQNSPDLWYPVGKDCFCIQDSVFCYVCVGKYPRYTCLCTLACKLHYKHLAY